LGFPEQYICYPEGLVNRGLYTAYGISGIGLVTNGFLWGMSDLYMYPESVDGVATGWTGIPSVTTNWTNGETATITNWTGPTMSIWGPYYP